MGVDSEDEDVSVSGTQPASEAKSKATTQPPQNAKKVTTRDKKGGKKAVDMSSLSLDDPTATASDNAASTSASAAHPETGTIVPATSSDTIAASPDTAAPLRLNTAASLLPSSVAPDSPASVTTVPSHAPAVPSGLSTASMHAASPAPDTPTTGASKERRNRKESSKKREAQHAPGAEPSSRATTKGKGVKGKVTEALDDKIQSPLRYKLPEDLNATDEIERKIEVRPVPTNAVGEAKDLVMFELLDQ